MCDAAHERRKGAKGQREGRIDDHRYRRLGDYYEQRFDSDMKRQPLWNMLKHFPGCFPPFVSLRLELSAHAGTAPLEGSSEVWQRCTRLFLNVNRGIHNHRVTSVSVCRSASSCLFFPTRSPKYSQTRTLKYSMSFSIPSSRFTLPFRCLITVEDCGTQC